MKSIFHVPAVGRQGNGKFYPTRWGGIGEMIQLENYLSYGFQKSHSAYQFLILQRNNGVNPLYSDSQLRKPPSNRRFLKAKEPSPERHRLLLPDRQ